ncbi:MAG: hypothetical protein K2K56_04430 [Lachnospiraceae bacterium]|nr:hypothetical protein [Lachnospiraceae bacterium]
MKIIEYENTKKLLDDLKYWCNSLGELHHHGEYDIKEDDLPEELKKAYNTLWTDGSGSLCYLVEYKGNYGIALINEFDMEFARDNAITMEEMLKKMKIKASLFGKLEAFQDTIILLGEYSGFDDCHEFITILPVDVEKERFNTVADLLYKHVYKI